MIQVYNCGIGFVLMNSKEMVKNLLHINSLIMWFEFCKNDLDL